MNEEQRAAKHREITEFRYALVAELANPYLSTAQVSELVRQKAAQEHQIPYIGKRRDGLRREQVLCDTIARSGSR